MNAPLVQSSDPQRGRDALRLYAACLAASLGQIRRPPFSEAFLRRAFRFRKTYLPTLKAFTCANDESLATAQGNASDKDHVLDTLGRLASAMRKQLGESLASVEKYDAPAENETTRSLKALKAYNTGYRTIFNNDYPGPISFV